jgi:hypothetical protein
MNNNDQRETMESKSGIGFCSNSFEMPGQQLINNYKCNEKQLSSPGLWNIQKSRRDFTRRTSNFAIN